MKHTDYLAALFLALAGPASVLAQRRYRGGRPAQPVATSPILNQLVNELSVVKQSHAVNQVVNRPTTVVPTAFKRYNPNYNPNPNPSPTFSSNTNPMVNPNPNPNPNTAVSTNLGATTLVTTGGTTDSTTIPSSGNGGNGNLWCFEFSMKGISDFFWSIQGVLSSQPPPAGSGDSSNANQCIPRAITGDSMFFSVVQNPAKCNTELERSFPNGQGQNTVPNCDISLVDGYSLNVACTIPGGSAPIGYNGNLNTYSNSVGHACQSPKSGECCQNLQGPFVSSLDQVDPFFSPAPRTASSIKRRALNRSSPVLPSPLHMLSVRAMLVTLAVRRSARMKRRRCLRWTSYGICRTRDFSTGMGIRGGHMRVACGTL